MVMEEEEITEESLLAAIDSLYANRQTYIEAMKGMSHTDSIQKILSLIDEVAK